jgi:sulfane dehydrogenase subunit SoxC
MTAKTKGDDIKTANQAAKDEAAKDRAAGNGLLDRRLFLRSGLLAGVSGAGLMTEAVQAEPLTIPKWTLEPGSPFNAYGKPSKFEDKVVRNWTPPANPATAGIGTARTPHHSLDGMITPNALHFERSHGGVPDIDPAQHRLAIHGLVKRPLVFTLEALSRYPMTSRISFIECGGNSGGLSAAQAAPNNVQGLHGLLSCAEWTGVKLSTLLDEAGIDPAAKWILAEGADSASVSRSIPLTKALDDCLVCLYQNGERIRPENGYPLRLLVPGYSGNMNIKWLRRIKLVDAPVMTKDETSKYTILLPSGKAWKFVFPLEVKSMITKPSPGLNLQGKGIYEISGLAWSGNGRITKVEVSADGGQSWAPALLQDPVLSKALTRFRLPWNWSGAPAILQSRATDDTGMVQPSRTQIIAERGLRGAYHFNAIASWKVDEKGELTNVFA